MSHARKPEDGGEKEARAGGSVVRKAKVLRWRTHVQAELGGRRGRPSPRRRGQGVHCLFLDLFQINKYDQSPLKCLKWRTQGGDTP